MRKIAVLILMYFYVLNQSVAQVQTPVYFSQTIPNAGSNGFYQYLPAGYATSNKNYPLIIWAHGAGQVGSGNSTDLPKVLQYGLPKIISQGGFPATFKVGDSTFSFIVISPQFMGWPSNSNMAGILAYVMNNYRVDPDRVYMMGISAGGGGVWDYASASIANSNKLAAIIPFAGTTTPTQTLASRIAASNLPVWAFHNTNDGTVPVSNSRNWKAYINSYTPTPNPLALLTEFPVVSNDAVIAHDCWTTPTALTYKPNGITIYEWLLQYKRRTVTTNALPLASAGQDQGIVLPANAILDGSASNDPDGVIVGYRWRKVSGPASYNFSDSTKVSPTVSNLVQGTYQFELTVTDNLNATSKATVNIIVYVSLPPGAQQRVLIDLGNAANNGGTTTTSPSINSNVWNNMTDARAGVRVLNALTINNQLSGIGLEVINRVDGTYSTGSTGMANGNTTGIVSDYPASATTDLALVNSSATNGLWKITGLQKDKIYAIKFWGARTNTTASRSIEIKRADDNIWKTYNATGNTNYNNSAVFNITGQTEMSFNIRTKAGSDFSAISVIDISYGADTTIVTPPANLPPVAKAGADTTLQLPVDSLILNGCSSFNPEGGLLKYKWKKIIGPTTGTLVGDTLCNVKAKTLVAGIYSFELTVTDTSGLTGKDTVAINVNALIPTPWPAQVTPLCSQPYKIVVVGSSTAYGTGATPIDSSWVKKFQQYLAVQNSQVSIINIATPSLTSYDVSPAGTVVPSPFTVDTTRNITRALSYHPDAIILNLPSNDVARGIPVSIIHSNFLNITAAADAQNIPVWVTTTQPRNGLSAPEEQLQMDLRDWINTTYATKSVDFWTTVSNTDGTINNFYSFGDGIHLNNYGHHILFTRIIGEKIWDTLCIRKNAAPVAMAGNDTTITSTPASIHLNGAASYDPEGSALTYNWRIISPANGVITNSTTVSALFSSAVSGNYIIELTVKDNVGKTGKDTINILIKIPNTPPVANAGNDFIYGLKTDSVMLNGAASYDPDGSVLKYKWEEISGPPSTLSNDSIAKPWVTHLVTGAYSFSLIITDDSLATSIDTVNFIANALPVANAGTDQTITLPAHTSTLNGSGSFDPDGNIVSYKWKKISGNSGVIITDTVAVQSAVSFVTYGLYSFELTVTDNYGEISKDTMKFTINPDPNTPPVANAGIDKTLQLPQSQILLDGRNSHDAEGPITFSWSVVSGPAGSQVLNPLKDTTSVNFATAGTYIFKLTVMDSGGLSASDSATVVVLPVPETAKKLKVNIYGGTNPFTDPEWNNWNFSTSATSNKFLYTDVTASNIAAIITDRGSMADNGANYASTATACPPAVLRYNSYGTSNRTLTLTGLNTAKKYNLDFFGSRASTGNSTVVQVGSKSDTIATSNNINDFAHFNNISSDNTGKIVITLSRIGTWQYLAGFIITEKDAATSQSNAFFVNTEKTILAESIKVEEVPVLASAMIYPNPANGLINVNIPDKIKGNYLITITDIQNRKVVERKGNKTTVSYSEKIDISNLEHGTYILQVASQTTTVKNIFVKL
ncbi:MAG: PKD domain-containing protein [Ferruginibacter sp.]